ncbi:winged helix-turn-helix domain-containing protein [Pseudomarimonas arenosa]|uniref:Winged helix-turn-helix domain-containing protein n=1 Tax=Pseudomarimonas arenosa TaxID=2774145 RepID=A0AAW3ZT85_9GAMM|nr:winged helix-turn-helix domain-containing protein [Pseudomarimonas arenosa]
MADLRHPPWPDDCPRLQLDDLRIDLRFRQLIDADGTRELSQRHFDLLCLLLTAPGSLHSRQHLLDSVWTGVVVEDANLSQAIWTLRRALGPTRRHWIRTVAKRGYVFESGCEIRPLSAEVMYGAQISIPSADTSHRPARQPRCVTGTAPDSSRPQPPDRRRGVRRFAMIAALLVLVVVAGGGLRLGPQLSQPAPVIALIEIERAGHAEAVPWPATLLRALVEWPLSLSPRLEVLTPEQVTRNLDHDTPLQLLLVSARESSDRAGHWQVQATLQGESGTRQAGVEVSEADLPAALSALAGQVVNDWWGLGTRDDLQGAHLSPGQAKRYVEFVRAKQKFAWSDAAEIGKALAADVPDWGMLRLQLSSVLGQLGEVQAARHHLQIGRARLGPLPGDLEWRVRALAAELDGDDLLALQQYRALEQRYPERAQFALESARMLLQRGQVTEALERMKRADLDDQPLWIQVRAALMRSQAMLQLGDAARSREAASWALQRSQSAGWPLEQGQAELNLAAAEMIDQRGITRDERYQRAAELFEQGGDPLRALLARLEGANLAGPEQADKALNALLARARQVGHRQVEIHALLMAAFRHYRDGDLFSFRRRHDEARAVAEAVGNQRLLLRMELDVVGLDLDAGDFSAAEQRLLRVRELGPQGESAFWLEHFSAALEWRRGRFQAARQRADAALQVLQADGAHAATVQALGFCARGSLAITAGELSRADSEFQRCARSEAPVYRLIAELGQARVALFAGDRARALQGLHRVQSRLAEVPAVLDRRGIKLDLLDLWTRAGALEQAVPLAEQLSVELAAVGGPGEQAGLALIKARIALIQGDRPALTSALQAATQRGAEDDWQLQSGLRLLAAYRDHAHGHSALAVQALQQLAADSRRREDVVMQVEAEVARLLIDPLNRSEHSTLLAESGLRGIQPIAVPEDRLAASGAKL